MVFVDKLKTYLIMFLLFLLERVLFARLNIFGLNPWISLAFVLSVSSVCDDFDKSMILAFISGLILDLLGGGIFGSSMLVFVLSALFINLLTKKLLKTNFILSLVLIFIAFLLGESVYFLINNKSLSGIFGSLLLLAFINTVISVIFYPLAKSLEKGGRRI